MSSPTIALKYWVLREAPLNSFSLLMLANFPYIHTLENGLLSSFIGILEIFSWPISSLMISMKIPLPFFPRPYKISAFCALVSAVKIYPTHSCARFIASSSPLKHWLRNLMKLGHSASSL